MTAIPVLRVSNILTVHVEVDIEKYAQRLASTTNPGWYVVIINDNTVGWAKRHEPTDGVIVGESGPEIVISPGAEAADVVEEIKRNERRGGSAWRP